MPQFVTFSVCIYSHLWLSGHGELENISGTNLAQGLLVPMTKRTAGLELTITDYMVASPMSYNQSATGSPLLPFVYNMYNALC